MHVLWFILAAIMEIAGCFSFWLWLRGGRSAWWLGPGVAALVVFAAALTRVDVAHAGRAYAAYAGIYLAASLAWLWSVEGVRPDRWDLVGSGICLAGTLVIVFAPR